jgi:hypothetical protein
VVKKVRLNQGLCGHAVARFPSHHLRFEVSYILRLLDSHGFGAILGCHTVILVSLISLFCSGIEFIIQAFAENYYISNFTVEDETTNLGLD